MKTQMRLSKIRILWYFLSSMWTKWGGRKRIEKKQLKNLRKLVAIARKDSPYFKRLYKGLPDTDKITLRDLPITYKPQLMKEFDDWVTDRTLKLADLRKHLSDIKNLGTPYGNVGVFRTSGTSGEPAVIIMTASDLEFAFGFALAHFNWQQLGLVLKSKRYGKNVTITGGSGQFAGVGVNLLLHQLWPSYAKDLTFIPAELPIHQIVNELNQMSRVASITAYPSTLSILAREKEAGRLKVSPLFFKAGGETLTQDLRDKVKRAFPSVEHEIWDAYGCTEFLLMSVKCRFGRKHIPEEWVILESVDGQMKPVPDGVLGESALLTSLVNEVQPFIRYELGDQIQFFADPCPCGSVHRSFEVIGRQATLLHIGDIILSPLVLDLEHESAQRVQLVQTSERQFDLRIEVQEGANRDLVFKEVIASVEKTFRENGISDFTINRSQELPKLGASGKFHEVIPKENKANP